MHPNYTVKHPKILYIDRYGNIFPDCKTYQSNIVGHISAEGIAEKVIKELFSETETPIFNMITVEVSSLCHAKCFYCFQEDGKRREKYLYFRQLMDFLGKLQTYWLFFSGGEILDQPDAMDFIRKYRKKYPDTWIHLKTNGNAGMDKVKFIEECCNSVMVSFNGFTNSSCQTLMKVDLDRTIQFCEAIVQNTSTNLGVKFLNSPICIAELPDFLNWALEINAKAIAVQTVYHYSFDEKGKSSRKEHVFNGLSGEYWKEVCQRVAVRTEAVLHVYKNRLNQETCNLACDKKVLQILGLSEEYARLFRTDGVYVIE